MRESRANECQIMILEGLGSAHQCRKEPVITRNGRRYCKIHDPAGQEKFDKEWVERRQRSALEAARRNATKGLTLKELQAISPEMIRGLLTLSQ